METQLTSPGVRQRITAVLFVAQSFFTASTIAAFTLSPIIAASLSGSEAAAGIPNTVGLVGRAAFAYPIGYLMDRVGRRIALTSGYSFAILGGLVSVWSIINNSYLAFVLGALFLGMSRTAGDQSRYVAAEVHPLLRRARMIGIIVFAGTIGAIGGPLLVGPSTDWASSLGIAAEAGPFALSAVFMAVASLTVFIFLRPDPQIIGREIAQAEAAADPTSRENNLFARPLLEIFTSPLVLLALLAMILGYFVMTFLMVITPLHMDHHLHSTRAISNVIMLHTLGMFGLSWLTGWLIDRYGRINMILAGAVVLILSCIVAPLSLGVPILGLALFLLGLGWNFAFVAGSSLLSDALSAQERGRAQGAAETLVALSSGVASLTVGVAFQQGDYLLVSGIGMFFSLLLVGAVFLLGRPPGRQIETPFEAEQEVSY